MSERRLLLTAVLAVTLSGCTTLDRAIGKVSWFTTMRDQVAVRPFEPVIGPDTAKAPRFTPPDGSIPVWGHEDSLDIYGAGLRAVDAMVNPVPADSASLARGDKIYHTYCTVCHGPQGRGNGPVAGRFGYVPDLTQDMTKQRSDGYIYAVMRHGRGIMPRYGDRIRDPRDRWNVINYVRSLQRASTP